MTPAEREHVQRVWHNARRAGHDPFEALDNSSQVLTNHRYHEIRADLLYWLALQLENADITGILRLYGASSHTAYDAQRVVTEWIRAHARKEEGQA